MILTSEEKITLLIEKVLYKYGLIEPLTLFKCHFCEKQEEMVNDFAFEYQYRDFDNICESDYIQYCNSPMCKDCWLRISKEIKDKIKRAGDLKSSQEWRNYFDSDDGQPGVCAGGE
jgi:hypothetical protein